MSISVSSQEKLTQSLNVRRSKLFIQGLLIILSNPKVLLFFLAFLPQFIDYQSPVFNQYLILTGTFVAVELVIEFLLAAFAGKINQQLSTHGFVNVFNYFTGGVFLLAATYLVGVEKTS